ncbi:dephospho-CoA kinase [Enterococcus timonensis]|uniref:dephospho-CoA kinase n=1 Tax=Enterococcus timonensis TaxID=1852364 RepID=UPI0008DA512E|nr:dephospho-CoA kinase [Enterococcus timonensis]
MTFILGLTGGIASGKSLVSQFFQEKNIPVLDGDIIARKVVEIGQPTLKKIADYFGQKVIKPDGTLNRQAIGAIVFDNPAELSALNKIMDEAIRGTFLKEIKDAQRKNVPLLVLDVPLLFEGKYAQYADETMVIAVDEKIQRARLMKRDGIDQASAQKKIRSQMSLAEKSKLADVVIDNRGTKEQTKQQISDWLNKNAARFH